MQGRKVALILSGGNIDREVYLRVLGGGEAGRRAPQSGMTISVSTISESHTAMRSA